jgi:general secretion pathway protein A
LAQLPEDVDSVLIFNPRLNDVELLATICDELRIDYPANTDSLKALVDALTEYLLAAHARKRRTVLIIDEAQNLSVEVLEQIRLLTNLETTQSKLLQVILVGQPELNRILQRKDLRQFTQRITSRCHLKSLSTAGLTGAYIYHRISVSGGDASKLFTRAVIRKIHRLSGSIPRLINLLCHRALQNAYLGNHTCVNAQILRKAAKEVRPILVRPWFRKPAYWAPALVALLIVGSAAGYYLYHFENSRLTVVPPANRQVPQAGHETLKKTLAQNTVSDAPVGDVNQFNTPAAGSSVMASQNAKALSAPSEAFADSLAFAELILEPKFTRSEAFARLFSQWKIGNRSEGIADDCAWALQNGLRCLFEKSNWHFMRRLNRPVILEFLVEDSQKRYATLVALDEYSLTLDLEPQHVAFPLEQVLPYWQGSYILLWKPPYRNISLLRPGDRSEAVLWLRQHLNKPDKLVPAVTEDAKLFDEELKKRVIAFQTSRGITPDGIVGPHTMIHLNTITNPPGTPMLERRF